jgi:hypothetical protein
VKVTRHPATRPRFGAIPESLILAGVVAAVALLYTCCAGCGGAIATQTTAIEVTALAASTAGDAVDSAMRIDLAACHDDPCTVAVETRYAPASMAHASLVAALSAWVGALELYRVAGESGVTVQAVIGAVTLVLEQWAGIVAAAAPLGVALPELPPLVLAAAHAFGSR